jgi:drug/metabolite transporter (DMT)-like permease
VCLRSLLLVLMWVAYFAALPFISLPTAAVAFYTAPLFIALLARTATGEFVGPVRWSGIVLGFAGVLVVLRPGTDEFSAAALLPVLAAVLYAAAAIVTRARCAGERALVLALGLNVGLLAAGAVATAALSLVPPPAGVAAGHPFLFGEWALMGGREWALMVLLAALMVAFGTGVAMAYQLAPAALVGTFDYAYVAFAVIWSYLLFAELPDAGAVAGMALIAAAGVLVACAPELPAPKGVGSPARPG